MRVESDPKKSFLEVLLTMGGLIGVVVSLLQPTYASVLDIKYYSAFALLFIFFVVYALLSYGHVLTGRTYSKGYRNTVWYTSVLFAGIVAFALFFQFSNSYPFQLLN